jgi:plastocyanin
MMRTLRSAGTLLVAMAALAGCGGDPDEIDTRDLESARADAAATLETGTIEGRVTLAGERPRLEPFDITVNADVCGSAAKNNLLTVSEDGGITGAVVYVDGPPVGANSEPQLFDQVGCQYTPRAIAASVGSVIRFRNSDPAAHNVRVESIETGRVHLNIAQPQKGRVDEWKVPEAGSYTVACDYHPWMNAYIVAAASGLSAVTGADGRFSIAGVPVGAHRIKVWHNSVQLREKRDQQGRLIGYRFDRPVLEDASVQVSKNASATVDVALELATKTTASK